MPVKDRLVELQRESKYVKKDVFETDKNKVPDQEMVLLQTKDMGEYCAKFFQNFQEVIGDIDKVGENVSAIRRLHGKILYEPVKNSQDEAKLHDLVDENKRLGVKIRKLLTKEQDTLAEKDLKEIRENLTDKKRAKESAKKLHELRMMKNQLSAQSRRFYDVWTAYNNEQTEYRDKAKELLVRRVRIVNSDLQEDEIEELLEKGDAKIFSASILERTHMAKKQLNELQDRHEEFLKLERSITEVHSLFLELGGLVTQQGEVIDSIFHNMEAAGSDAEKGAKELRTAEQHQKSARRMKIILACIVLVIVLVLLLVILVEFG